MKVIFVGDQPTLNAVRGGTFGLIVKEMQNFITNLDFKNDCQVIITKASEDTQ